MAKRGPKPKAPVPNNATTWNKSADEAFAEHNPIRFTNNEDLATTFPGTTLRYLIDTVLPLQKRERRELKMADSSWVAAAGIGHFRNNLQLRRFLASQPIWDIVSCYLDCQSRDLMSGGGVKSNSQIPIKTVFTKLVDATEAPRIQLLARRTPAELWTPALMTRVSQATSPALNLPDYPFWVFIDAVIHVILAAPEVFTTSAPASLDQDATFDEDDLVRSALLVKFCLGQRAKGFDNLAWGAASAGPIAPQQSMSVVYFDPEADDEDDPGRMIGATRVTADQPFKTSFFRAFDANTQVQLRAWRQRDEETQRKRSLSHLFLGGGDERAESTITDERLIIATQKTTDALLRNMHNLEQKTRLNQIDSQETLEILQSQWSKVRSRRELPAHLSTNDMEDELPAHDEPLHESSQHLARQEAPTAADGEGDEPEAGLVVENVAIRTASIPYPTYEEARARVHPDGEGLFLEHKDGHKDKLYPHQTIAAYCMEQAFNGPLNGLILGFGCGLGKTIAFLASTLYFLRRRREKLPEGPFFPTMVLGPSSVCLVWVSEYTTHFSKSFNLAIFMGSMATSSRSGHVAKYYVSTQELLDGFYLPNGRFHPQNPGAHKQLILSSYETWQARTMRSSRAVTAAREQARIDITTDSVTETHLQRYKEIALLEDQITYISRSRLGARSGTTTDASPDRLENDEVQEGDDDFNQRATRRGSKQGAEELECIMSGLIGILGLDEAHHLRNRRTAKHRAIRKTEQQIGVCALSATLLNNSTSDLIGILEILYPAQLDLPENFDLGTCRQPSDLIEGFYENGSIQIEYLANPEVYRALIERFSVSVGTAYRILPRIYSAILLRAEHGQVVRMGGGREDEKIGRDIPPRKIFTIYSSPTPTELGELQSNWLQHAPFLRYGPKKADSPESHGLGTLSVRQNLQAASFLPASARISSRLHAFHALAHDNPRMGDKLQAVVELSKMNDLGATLALSALCSDSAVPVEALVQCPRIALEFLANSSPKLRALAGPLAYHVSKRHEKMVVLAEVPRTCWLVGIFLFLCRIPYRMVHSALSQAERLEIISDFNDPNGKAKVLLSTSRLIGEGQNIHKDCHNMAVLELPRNCSELEQIMGRVSRAGQTHNQNIYLVVTENSYDEKMLASMVQKHLSIISGFVNYAKEHMRKLLAEAMQDLGLGDDELDSLTKVEKERVQAAATQAEVNRIYGFEPYTLTNVTRAIADIGIDDDGASILDERRRLDNLSRLDDMGIQHFAFKYNWNLSDADYTRLRDYRDALLERSEDAGKLLRDLSSITTNGVNLRGEGNSEWSVSQGPQSTPPPQKPAVENMFSPHVASSRSGAQRIKNLERAIECPMDSCFATSIYAERFRVEAGKTTCNACIAGGRPLDSCFLACREHKHAVSKWIRAQVSNALGDDHTIRDVQPRAMLQLVPGHREDIIAELLQHFLPGIHDECAACRSPYALPPGQVQQDEQQSSEGLGAKRQRARSDDYQDTPAHTNKRGRTDEAGDVQDAAMSEHVASLTGQLASSSFDVDMDLPLEEDEHEFGDSDGDGDDDGDEDEDGDGDGAGADADADADAGDGDVAGDVGGDVGGQKGIELRTELGSLEQQSRLSKKDRRRLGTLRGMVTKGLF